MDVFESLFVFLDEYLGSAAYFPFLLLGVGVFFTFYLGFPQIRFFKHAWGVLRGKHTEAGAPGDTNHFQALSTALSGTVGTGNIGGVAFAIYLGGPAALFWMWATAFVGMTTKFVEVTISHKYRVKDDEGRMAGGPMYYMERGLNMRWLAVFFAIALVISSFGSGNLPQSNNMASGLEASFGIPTWMSGAVLSVLLGMVIIGGIRRIAIVAASIVPVMGIFYAIGALAVAISNADQILPSFAAVFRDAFSGSAAAGGFLGATFAYAFEPFIDTLLICTLTGLVILSSGVWMQKFQTDFAPFDMEIVAGGFSDDDPEHVAQLFAHLDIIKPDNDPVQPLTGSLQVVDGRAAGLEHTVIHNRSVAEQVVYTSGGRPFTGTLEVEGGGISTPNIDVHGRSLLHSVPLTAKAFEQSFLGEFGQYAVTIGLVMFAFSTALAWSYYGDRAITYLFGLQYVTIYRITYVIGFFAATIADTSLIWLISAVTLALMTIPNLIGLVLMRREVKTLTNEYWQKVKNP
jgi:AGCS family alanine or glycine:cation symporter